MFILTNKKTGRQLNIDLSPGRYLYSTIFFLDSKFQLSIFDLVNVTLDDMQIRYFDELCQIELRRLIVNCYVAPSPRSISLHPGRYEVFIFDGRKFHVNALQSRVGNVLFKFSSILRFNKEILETGADLSISYKEVA